MTVPRPISTIALALLGLIIAVVPGRSDQIELNSGEKFTGRVLQESDETLRFEIHISSSIRETRTFQLDQIAAIERNTPAEWALINLTEQTAPADRRTVDDYDNLLALVDEFLEKHGDSPQAAEAERIREALAEAREKVADGAMRIAGTWYTAAERARNPYEFNAMLLAERMRDDIRQEDLVDALRSFETLLEKYPLSSHTITAIPEARKTIADLQKRINRMITDNPHRIEQRAQARRNLPPDQAKRVAMAIEKEREEFEQLRALEAEEGMRWRSFDPFHIASLEETRARLQETAEKLELLDVGSLASRSENFIKGLDLLREARELMDEKRYTEALAKVDEAGNAETPPGELESIRDEIAEARRAIELPPDRRPRQPNPVRDPVAEIQESVGTPLSRTMREQRAEAEQARQDRLAAEQGGTGELEPVDPEPEETPPGDDPETKESEPETTAEPESGEATATAADAPSSSEDDDPVGDDPGSTSAESSGDIEDPSSGTSSETSEPVESATSNSTNNKAGEEPESEFISILNMVILGLAALMVVAIIVMKVTDLGSARRENAQREIEEAEKQAAALAEEELESMSEEELLAAAENAEREQVEADGQPDEQQEQISLVELEAQAETPSTDAPDEDEREDEQETHTAKVPGSKVEPPVPSKSS